MAWTAPRTWVVNEITTAAQFNTHLRDNLLSIRDDGTGSRFVVLNDESEKLTNAFASNEEKMRATILMGDHWAAGQQLSLRMFGYRRVATLGGGGDTIYLDYGVRNAGDTGDPTFTTLTTIATSNDTSSTYKDSGWVDVPMTLHALVVVRYGVDAGNTGQQTWTRMTVMARIK